MNEGSNFLGGSFGNRDNARAPIQFRRERQPQHLKRLFFLKNRSICFHVNSTSQTKLGQTRLVEFFHDRNQQATSCPSPVSRRSVLSLEANSSCYHGSDA